MMSRHLYRDELVRERVAFRGIHRQHSVAEPEALGAGRAVGVDLADVVDVAVVEHGRVRREREPEATHRA